jgi:hypothetical protein
MRLILAVVLAWVVVSHTTPASAQDTAACQDYFAYAKTAGGNRKDLDQFGRPAGRLKDFYDACLRSRNGRTGNVQNTDCDCPPGSQCVNGGNRCVQINPPRPVCGRGYENDWDGDCILKGRKSKMPVE